MSEFPEAHHASLSEDRKATMAETRTKADALLSESSAENVAREAEQLWLAAYNSFEPWVINLAEIYLQALANSAYAAKDDENNSITKYKTVEVKRTMMHQYSIDNSEFAPVIGCANAIKNYENFCGQHGLAIKSFKKPALH